MIETKNYCRGLPSAIHLLGMIILLMPSILNADWTPPPQPGQFCFSNSAYNALENQTSIIITVMRINGCDGYVTVNYATCNQTAVSGKDYDHCSGTLSWQNGDSSPKTFSVPILEDQLYEGNETFKISLSSPNGGATLAQPYITIVTIQDNDAPPEISLKYKIVYVLESAPSAWVIMELSEVSGLPTSIDYTTVDDTALSGIHYMMTSGALSIQPGDTEGRIPINIIDNSSNNDDLMFSVHFTNPQNVIMGDYVTPVFILDDEDGAPSLITPLMDYIPEIGYIGEGSFTNESGNAIMYALQTGELSPDAFTVKGRLGDPVCEFPAIQIIAIGDLDGDGKEDLIIGERSWGMQDRSMEIGVFWGSPDRKGQDLDLFHGDSPDVLIYTTDYVYLKNLVCGDFNSDGYDDLFIGSFNPGNGESQPFLLFNGKPRDQWPAQINITDFENVCDAVIYLPVNGNGRDVAVGNIDDDDFDDLVLGIVIQSLDERGDPIFDKNLKTLYVLFGDNDANAIQGPISLSSPSVRSKIITWDLGLDDDFARKIECADFDADGYDDVLVSAPDADIYGGIDNGYIHVIGGANITHSEDLLFPCGVSFYGSEDGEKLGYEFSMGDVNRDGFADLIIGNPFTAKVSIIFGQIFGSPEMMEASEYANIFIETHYSGQGFWNMAGSFGSSVSSTDFNGDGYDDIIVGAPDQGGSYGTGYVYIIRGRSNVEWSLSPHIFLDPDMIGNSNEFIALSGGSLGGVVKGGGDFDLNGMADCSAQSRWFLDEPHYPDPLNCRGFVATVFGSGVPDGSARGVKYFRNGDTGVKGFGGRLSPTVRTRLSFKGGRGASYPQDPSQIIVTCNRSFPDIGGLPNAAKVNWILNCLDRHKFTTAKVTFQYLDSEIAGMNENNIRLYYYSIPDYQWIAVTDQRLDIHRNEVAGLVYSFDLQYPLTFALSDDPGNLHAPASPETISPTLNVELVSPLPQLVAGIPYDPDGPGLLTYDFHIFSSQGDTLYRNYTQTFDAADPQNVFYDRVRHQAHLSPPLTVGETYFWRVRVRDQQNHCSAWSAPEEFQIRYGYVGVEGRWFKREQPGDVKEIFIPNGPNLWGSGMAYAGWIDNMRDRFYWEMGGPGDQYLCYIKEHGVNVLHLYIDNAQNSQPEFLIQQAYSDKTTSFNADVIEDIDIFFDALERNGIYYTIQMLVAVPGLSPLDVSPSIWFNTTIKKPNGVLLTPDDEEDKKYFLREFLNVDTTDNPEHHEAFSDRVDKFVTQWGARPGLIGWIPGMEFNLFYHYLPISESGELQYIFARHYYNLINSKHDNVWPGVRRVPITYSEANLNIYPDWIDPNKIPQGEPMPLDFRDMHLYTGGVGVDPNKHTAITPSNAVGPVIESGGVFSRLFSPSSVGGPLYEWSKYNQKPVISMESGPFGWDPEWLSTGSQHWYLPRWIYEQGNHNMVMMSIASGLNGAPASYFSRYYLHLPPTDYERSQWDIFGSLYRDGNGNTPIYLHPEEIYRTHACVSHWLSLLDLENLVDSDYDCVTKNQNTSDNIFIVQPDPMKPDHKIFASSDGKQAIGWLLHYNEDDKKHFWERPGELEPYHSTLEVEERPTIYIKGLIANGDYYIRWFHDETMTSNDVSYVTDGDGNLTFLPPGYAKHIAFAVVPQSSAKPISPHPELVLSHEARVVGDESNTVVNIHEEFPDVIIDKKYYITQIIPSVLSGKAKSYYHTLKLKHPDVSCENLWPTSVSSPPNLPDPIPWTPDRPGIHHLILIDELRVSPDDPKPAYILKDQIDVAVHANKTPQGRRYGCSFNHFPWNSDYRPVWRPGSDWTYRPIQSINVLTQHVTLNIGTSHVMPGVPFGCFVQDPIGEKFPYALFPFRSMTHILQDHDIINPHKGAIDFYIITNWGSKEILDQPDPEHFLSNYCSMIRAFSKNRNTPDNTAFGLLFDAGRLFLPSDPFNPCLTSPAHEDIFFVRFFAQATFLREDGPFVWYSFSNETPLQDHWPAHTPLRVTLSWDLYENPQTNMRIVRLDNGYELGQDPLTNCYVDGAQRNFLISGTNPDPRHYHVRPYTMATGITDGKIADCRIYDGALTPIGLRVGDFTTLKDVPLNDKWMSAQRAGNYALLGPQEIIGNATDSNVPEFQGIDFSPYSNIRDVWFFTDTTNAEWYEASAIFEAGNEQELDASALYAYQFNEENNLVCIGGQITTAHSGNPDTTLNFTINDLNSVHNIILWRLRTAAKEVSIFPSSQKFMIMLDM